MSLSLRVITVAAFVLSALSGISADSRIADAVEKSDRATIRTLLKQHADVNAPQVDGMTALHWAAHLDDLETTKVLLKAKANVNATNRYGVTPLSLACVNGNPELVESLLEAGANPNASLRGGETVLMTAARTGKVGPVKALLSRGAIVDAKERRGQTALMWAAADGHAAVVELLLKAGADFRDGEGVPRGNKELLKLGATALPSDQLPEISDFAEWVQQHAQTRAGDAELFDFALRDKPR